jgi:RNA polymerase sigma-B factor
VPSRSTFPVDPPTRPREHPTDELIPRWHRDADRRARDELFERFLPLARRLARRYVSSHEPFEDLVQVASVGLLAAIDRFDPERGIAFQSFAIPTILGELKRHFRNTGWAVHVPRSAQELALRIDQAVREIETKLGRHPSVQEVAEYLEVSAEDVLAGLDAAGAHYAMSLDAPVTTADPEEGATVIDTIGRADEGYGLSEMKLSLAVAVGRLPYLEREALSRRLEGERTQTDVGRELGCSQMQVSRLLRRAASHLREMTDPDLG